MVTGFARAAVHVAVIRVPCLAESWTEGSLTVQFALTIMAVFAVHGPLPPNRFEALKSWPLAGAAAVWSTAAEGGATRKPTSLQSPAFPKLAADSSAAAIRPPKNTLHEIMIDSSFRLDNSTVRVWFEASSHSQNAGDLSFCGELCRSVTPLQR